MKSTPTSSRAALSALSVRFCWRIAAAGWCVGGAAVAFVATVPALRAQAAAATIEGRVRNVESGNLLNNARVAVEGTTLETLTNENGEFRLANVPVGARRLRVTYTGMEPQAVTVDAAAGTVARKDVDLNFAAGQSTMEKGLVKLEAFVVESAALSAAAAAVMLSSLNPKQLRATTPRTIPINSTVF